MLVILYYNNIVIRFFNICFSFFRSFFEESKLVKLKVIFFSFFEFRVLDFLYYSKNGMVWVVVIGLMSFLIMRVRM